MLLCIAYVYCAAVTGAPVGDSATAVIDDSLTHVPAVLDSADTAAARMRNPWVGGLLSAALPGAGQLYNRSYAKAVLFPAAEAGLLVAAVYRYGEAQSYLDSIERFTDIATQLYEPGSTLDMSRIHTYTRAVSDTVYDSAGVVVSIDTRHLTDTAMTRIAYRMRLDTASFKRLRHRHSMANAICWAAGCHVWSILDAMEKSGRFENEQPRNPRRAGLLSAIPGLGLGQIYNGKFSKAGMVLMVQTSLAVMSYNYHTQFTHSERQLQRIEDVRTTQRAVDVAHGYAFSDEWDSMRREAFRNRNTYLWYSLFFYLYGVFDAVVDAHLHDYNARMRLEPDLDVPRRAVGMRMSVDLAPRRRARQTLGTQVWQR